MPNQIMMYAIGGLAIAFALFAWNVNSEIDELNDRINKLKVERGDLQRHVGSLESQKYQLKSVIDTQNLKIKEMSIEYDVAMDEFNNRPPEVKYKVIYEYMEVKSDECNDTKEIIDVIRNTSYSEL